MGGSLRSSARRELTVRSWGRRVLPEVPVGVANRGLPEVRGLGGSPEVECGGSLSPRGGQAGTPEVLGGRGSLRSQGQADGGLPEVQGGGGLLRSRGRGLPLRSWVWAAGTP